MSEDIAAQAYERGRADGAAEEREAHADEAAMIETWRAAVVGMGRRLDEANGGAGVADPSAEYLDAVERGTDSSRLKAAVESVRRDLGLAGPS